MYKLIILIAIAVFTFCVQASGTVVINGKNIKSREELHNLLQKSLDFPATYGKNLDALYDVLSSDVSGESIIKLKNINILRTRISNTYVNELIETIADASVANPRIVILLE